MPVVGYRTCWCIFPLQTEARGLFQVYTSVTAAASEARIAPELPGAEPSGGGKAGGSDAIGAGMWLVHREG